jgi:N-acetyl sugar amidotransferase
MKECSKCLIKETTDAVTIDADGVCSVCKAVDCKHTIDWPARRLELDAIVAEAKARNDQWDCIIPYSGGKDSAWQALFCVRELKLRPLLVRYNHWHMRPGVEDNNVRLFKELGVDFLDFRANWKIVREMTREGILRRGDGCQHCHQGVYSWPMQVAVKFKIPLILWGEKLAEYQSFFSYGDKEKVDEVRFNRAMTQGITADDYWQFFKDRGFDERDLAPFKYPPKEDLEALGVKSICLGDYVFWDTRANVEQIKKELGWKGAVVEGRPDAYDYEKIECFAQGQRDFSKFVKRGFGRGNHLANIDIRHGRLTREEGDEMQRANDGKRPHSLPVFLDMMGLTEDEFMETLRMHEVDPWTSEGINFETGPALPDIDQWR